MGKRFIDEHCSSELAARKAAWPRRARRLQRVAARQLRRLSKAILDMEVFTTFDIDGWQAPLRARKLHSSRSVEREFM